VIHAGAVEVIDASGNRVSRVSYDAVGGVVSVRYYGLDGWDTAKAGTPAGNEQFDVWVEFNVNEGQFPESCERTRTVRAVSARRLNRCLETRGRRNRGGAVHRAGGRDVARDTTAFVSSNQ
jgi:hypothetical protein